MKAPMKPETGDRRMDRRQWLMTWKPLAGLMAAALAAGCSGTGAGPQKGGGTRAVDCTELKGLTDEERKAREALGYEASATDPERRCSGCALFVPAKEGACAGCMLFKGPILPEGSCIQFQPRPV